MIKDATRRALRVVRKAREALPAGPQATSSSSPLPLPKLVQLPVPRLPKPTVPSLSRLLGKRVQPPLPPKKEKNKKQAANAQEDAKTPFLRVGDLQPSFSNSITGKVSDFERAPKRDGSSPWHSGRVNQTPAL